MGQPGLPANRDPRPVPARRRDRQTVGVIHEVDSALRTLIEREADGTRDVEIVFDAPTREWAGRRNSPTIDVYLYDIREDMRRRERGMHNVYDENNVVVSRSLPPRHFKLSYLVTAWTQRPEDEHRLLSSLLSCFLRYEALPEQVLTGPLAELGLPVPITIALPPPEDRAFADVWSALGGELKPSIDLVVITPLDTGQQFFTGPPVQTPPRIALGGSSGWPTQETKSRDGVEVWPEGAAGTAWPDGAPVVQRATAGSATAKSSKDKSSTAKSSTAKSSTDSSEGDDDHGEEAGAESGSRSGGSGGGTKTSRGRRTTTSGGRRTGSSAAEKAGDDEAGADEGGAEGPTVWEVATSWANAMAPLGSVESTASSDQPASDEAGTGSGDGGTSGGRSRSSGGTARGSSGTARGGAAKGRPGTRVAMTRTRKPKKST
jgi:Pvc16 N-terminal domain